MHEPIMNTLIVAPKRQFLSKIVVISKSAQKQTVELYFTDPGNFAGPERSLGEFAPSVLVDASMFYQVGAGNERSKKIAQLTRLTEEVDRCTPAFEARFYTWGFSEDEAEVPIREMRFSDYLGLQNVLNGAEMDLGPSNLAPVMRWMATSTENTSKSIFLFVTDRMIDDLDAVVEETERLSIEIGNGARADTKLILIVTGGGGVSCQLREQIEYLDHLQHFPKGNRINLDLWDGKILEDLRSCYQVWAEIGTDSMLAGAVCIKAPNGQKLFEAKAEFPRKICLDIDSSWSFLQFEVFGQRFIQPLE